jgi:hypothetical protein
MKRVVLGVFLGVGLLAAAVAVAQQRGETVGHHAAPAAVAGSELIVVPAALGEKAQMLTVIDPRLHVMCVYHIDLVTGKIALKSVRSIHWDLQITDFNNESPGPKEIQSTLDQTIRQPSR